MDSSTIVIILSAILGGGTIAALVRLYLVSPSEVQGQKISNYKEIANLIEEMITKQAHYAEKFSALQLRAIEIEDHCKQQITQAVNAAVAETQKKCEEEKNELLDEIKKVAKECRGTTKELEDQRDAMEDLR